MPEPGDPRTESSDRDTPELPVGAGTAGSPWSDAGGALGAEPPRRTADPDGPARAGFRLRDVPARVSDGRALRGLLTIGWLGFLAVPIGAFFREPQPLDQLLLVGVVLAVVLGTLVWALRGRQEGQAGPGSLALAAVALVAAVVLTLAVGWSWDTLFLFAAIAAGQLRPARRASAAVLVVTAVAAGTVVAGAAIQGFPAGADFGSALSFVLNTLLIGLITASFIGMLLSIAELRAARSEIARLAVAEERARIARDLHDLLGHTLSMIALKSELAGRLLPGDPDRARDEIRDIETVARESLREVREAVAGYRQATLSAELAGARVLLEAAGIACDVRRDVSFVPATADGPLGWAVREGVTNVIRHSRATHCWIRTSQAVDEFGVEILDDGRGTAWQGAGPAPGAGIGGGHGLAGLAERASAMGGRLEAGRRPEGGFRLAVWVRGESGPLRSGDEAADAQAGERAPAKVTA